MQWSCGFFFLSVVEWGVQRAQVVHDHGFNLCYVLAALIGTKKKGHDKMNGSMHCYIGITLGPSNLKERLNSGAPLYKQTNKMIYCPRQERYHFMLVWIQIVHAKQTNKKQSLFE
jgi:hypothetical protein